MGTASSSEDVDSDGTVSSNGTTAGVSKGAIAGGVIAAVIVLASAVALLLWYRRRQRMDNASVSHIDAKPDVPAPADAVLSRPDPVEKPRSPSPSPRELDAIKMYNTLSKSTINLDPQAQYSSPANVGLGRRPSANGSVKSNPFADTHSIQTTSASTQSTNVIPIALVPHGSLSPSENISSSSSGSSSSPAIPARPAVSPDLGIRFDPLNDKDGVLNLEHVNISDSSFRPPNAPYAESQVSGFSGFSNRSSVMTSGSFASDMLYEAPQIVTPMNGGVRQVLGVAKAAVVLAPGSGPSTPAATDTNSSLKPNSSLRVSRPPVRSPLAQTSFGPGDVLNESDAEGQEIEIPSHSSDPFGDEHSPSAMGLVSGNSVSLYNMPTPVPLPSTASPTRTTYQPPPPPEETPTNDRPVSTWTQAASIIGAEIQGATLVRIGSARAAPVSAQSLNTNRLTSAKLVSPSSAPLRVEDDHTLQDQQALALAAARARAIAAGLPMLAESSASSTTSGISDFSGISGISGISEVSGISQGRPIGVGRLNGLPRRISDAASVASAGGDPLLENFTFVPPSPIASRPSRSPLAAQEFARQQEAQQIGQISLDQSALHIRHQQGLSMATQASADSALEGYDFRFGSSDGTDSVMPLPPTPDSILGERKSRGHGRKPSNATNASGVTAPRPTRQRASLDTLALTQDLSAFPLNFDEGRGSFSVSR